MVTALFLARQSVATTQSLLKNGADVNVVVGDYGFTGLHLVARLGTADVVEALTEAGADVAAQPHVHGFCAWRNVSGLEPLDNAARGCNLGRMTVLLRHGAGVNAIDEDDQTPPHWLCKRDAIAADVVCRRGRPPTVLRWGADETLIDIRDNTPRQRITRGSDAKRLRKLLYSERSSGQSMTPPRPSGLVPCFPQQGDADEEGREGESRPDESPAWSWAWTWQQ